jgi:OmpA-OmpF porin, OOP family
MKLQTAILTLSVLILFSSYSNAQFDLGKKLKKKVEKRIEKGVDKTIDKGLDATEDAIENTGTENQDNQKGNNQTGSYNTGSSTTSGTNQIESSNSNQTPDEKLKMWSKYDFVAGDKVIFEDDLAGEEIGEFPSRWDLVKGSTEVAQLGSDNVIHFTNNNSIIVPLMDKKNFLPEVFTIEFDAYFDELATKRTNFYSVRFYDGAAGWKTIDGLRRYPIDIKWNEVKKDKFGSRTKDYQTEQKSWKGKWKRVAIAFNQRSLKVYLDEERVINIPNLGYKPELFSIGVSYDTRHINSASIKNVRLNQGGKTLYERILSDGKFVTTGILFNVNKSTIKGESMGTINEIVKIMKDHSDLKFSIEGHTDSDGDDSFNQKLSEERAASVKNAIVESGIDASRLTIRGWGESKPVDSNSTSEGKANNRRVEFIKL